MTRLETVRVTRASADQRRGRAGRTAPGIGYRLWDAAEEAGFLAHRVPEIRSADLAPLLLELAAAGVTDPEELRWLDPPPSAPVSQGRDLLRLLEALDDRGRITAVGKRMAALALHPRLARMTIRAVASNDGGVAAVLAALLSDRDPARRTSPHELPDVDVRLRIEAVVSGRTPAGFEVDRGARHRLVAEAKEWRRRLGVPADAPVEGEDAGRLLAWAFPDRIAQRRSGQAGRYLLRNGRGAAMPPNQPLALTDYLVAAELEDSGSESRIAVAAPLDAGTVAELVKHHGRVEQVVEWDSNRRTARVVDRTSLGAIVVSERVNLDPPLDLLREAVLGAVAREGLTLIRWSDEASALRRRIAFLHHVDPDGWPDVGDEALLATLGDWLGPALHSASLDDADLISALGAMLGYQRRARVDRLAPERYEVPTGSMIRIDYSDPSAPVLAVRLQEMFGVTETPRIADGAVGLTVHLLSPAHRPLQVTRDLGGFWRTSYFDVRREMRGRYPRHEWPENPLDATPTRRAKRR